MTLIVLFKKNKMNLPKNPPYAIATALAILISPAQAQTSSTTCTSSPGCCWVVESWKKMGQITSASSTNATACCTGIPGVTCTSTGIVTEINWHGRGLRGSIPPELGNLSNLRNL